MENRTVTCSPSRENRTGADEGVAVQPAGTSSATSACAAPLLPLVTVTRTSRARLPGILPRAHRAWRTGAARVAADATGTTAISGLTDTAKAGTTWSSIRFSPTNRLPS